MESSPSVFTVLLSLTTDRERNPIFFMAKHLNSASFSPFLTTKKDKEMKEEKITRILSAYCVISSRVLCYSKHKRNRNYRPAGQTHLNNKMDSRLNCGSLLSLSTKWVVEKETQCILRFYS